MQHMGAEGLPEDGDQDEEEHDRETDLHLPDSEEPFDHYQASSRVRGSRMT